MSNFHTIKTTGFYSALNGAECMLIGRVADSNLLRVEIAGGTQIDLLDSEVVAPAPSIIASDEDMERTAATRYARYNKAIRSYESRVRALEAEGMTRSDAQAVADAQDLGGAS